jgi:DNA-directed RNA polymerase subunit RPC12/RpoP
MTKRYRCNYCHKSVYPIIEKGMGLEDGTDLVVCPECGSDEDIDISVNGGKDAKNN